MKYFLSTTALTHPVLLMAPTDGGAAGTGGAGAGGDGGTGGAGADAGGGAGASTGAGGDAGGNAGAGDAGGDKPWYDTREWSDPTLKEFAVKNGYHSGTADEALDKALKGEMTAAAKLGKDPKSLVELPGEGATALDFLKSNGDRLGLPDSVDKYELALPDDLPEGLPIDQDMLDSFRQTAFEAGLPPDVAQASVNFYAKHVTDWMSEQQGKIAAAEQELETSLKAEWGGNWEANRDLGVRAFQTIAAKIGLDADVTKNIASKLNEGMGDVHLVKFTHGLSLLIGEDGLATPRGGDVPTADLASAQQRKAQIMTRHTGDMAKARGNPARIKELQTELTGLNRIIEQHTSR